MSILLAGALESALFDALYRRFSLILGRFLQLGYTPILAVCWQGIGFIKRFITNSTICNIMQQLIWSRFYLLSNIYSADALNQLS